MQLQVQYCPNDHGYGYENTMALLTHKIIRKIYGEYLGLTGETNIFKIQNIFKQDITNATILQLFQILAENELITVFVHCPLKRDLGLGLADRNQQSISSY